MQQKPKLIPPLMAGGVRFWRLAGFLLRFWTKIIIHAHHVVVLTDSGLPMAAAQVVVAVFGFVTSASQMAAVRLIC
ncbi:hypothetical protein NEIFLAOT_01761 [Neisseria flavescens NRL30031/H210]|uniref:Uncharacterized protein n=1 Tax=Neisseria flavescens NRL30031/H210 TaxID=546264 RepID=C0EP71_NEIFL|nr:hypothetical protein NEIFLAOT_01761 [Neisseria flavescens NRL30031/H210]